MALPFKVARGSWQHWAGRIILFGGVGLFIWRAAITMEPIRPGRCSPMP